MPSITDTDEHSQGMTNNPLYSMEEGQEDRLDLAEIMTWTICTYKIEYVTAIYHH